MAANFNRYRPSVTVEVEHHYLEPPMRKVWACRYGLVLITNEYRSAHWNGATLIKTIEVTLPHGLPFTNWIEVFTEWFE